MHQFLITSRLLRLWQLFSLTACLTMLVMIFGMGDSTLATSTLTLNPPWDKLLHATVYGTMAGLLQFSGAMRSGLAIWLILLAVGAIDEIQQIHIPGREANFLDLLADAIGCLLGVAVMARCQRIIQVRD